MATALILDVPQLFENQFAYPRIHFVRASLTRLVDHDPTDAELAMMDPADIDLPDVHQPDPNVPEEPPFSRLPRQALYADLLSSSVFAVFVTLGATALVISLFFNAEHVWLALIVVLTLYGLFLLWCFGWPVLSHRQTSYRAGPDGLEIRRGVLWRSHHRVPRSRIQHGDVAQGPFQRPLGIARLSVFTAGTARHTTSLQGIEVERAYQLRDQLLASDEQGPEEPHQELPAKSDRTDSDEEPPAALETLIPESPQ